MRTQPRSPIHTITTILLAGILAALWTAQAEDRSAGAETVPREQVELSVWQLPRPESTDIRALCDRAVIRAFQKKFPHIKLKSPTGIQIPELGMDSKPLMAIAGGVSPDVIYVNFRQSDTYIQEGFLYPLDEWYEKLSEEERQERVLPQVKKVVYRWGPGKKTGEDTGKHYWALPYGNYIKGLVWRKTCSRPWGWTPSSRPATGKGSTSSRSAARIRTAVPADSSGEGDSTGRGTSIACCVPPAPVRWRTGAKTNGMRASIAPRPWTHTR